MDLQSTWIRSENFTKKMAISSSILIAIFLFIYNRFKFCFNTSIPVLEMAM